MAEIRFAGARPGDFEATIEVDPGNDEDVLIGLTRAIAAAAQAAAGKLQELGRDTDKEVFFKVSSIQVGVKPNPGPTSYKVTITPGG